MLKFFFCIPRVPSPFFVVVNWQKKELKESGELRSQKINITLCHSLSTEKRLLWERDEYKRVVRVKH